MQRTGQRRELLRGPLLYGLAHACVPLLSWRRSPAGVVAIAVLCGGDGLAEVAGRSRLPRRALPHNPNKVGAGCQGTSRGNSPCAGIKQKGVRQAARGRESAGHARCTTPAPPHAAAQTVAGSLACLLGGATMAQALLLHLRALGLLPHSPGSWVLLRGALLCSAAGAAVESLPLGEWDNAAVPAAALAAAKLAFR
jgi:hypothetical protein